MTLRIRHIDPDATPTSQVSLEALARIVPEATVREVLEECKATERRTRKLSAAFVVILCVAMNLYTNDCISHVFFRLLSRVRWLLSDPKASRVSKGALCQAAGSSVQEGLQEAFGRARERPRGVPVRAAPHGRRRHRARLARHPRERSGLRQAPLPARDERLAAGEGGRHKRMRHPRGSGGGGVAPRLRRACRRTEAFARGGRRGVVAVGPGLHSFEMVRGTLARGCELLGRLPRTVKPGAPVATLSDGTQLVWVRPSDYGRRKRGERVLVRLIRYTLEDPNRPGHRIEHRLITSLLDPEQAGAEELVVAYHSRWEFELAVDEIKSHQRADNAPLRSKKAVGVVQEIYALLIAHYVLRAVMVEAAKKAALPPRRLSFTNALRLVREMIPEAQRTAEADHPRLYRGLLEEVAAEPLAPRANRCNPRVVKRKMSKFGVKGPSHRDWPQPTKPFREAVVLLN